MSLDQVTPIIRAYHTDLEVRAGGDGRTIVGIAVPFDSPAEIRERGGAYTEVFRRGAFAKTLAERGDKVKFHAMHETTKLPLGRATSLREDPVGLVGEFHVSKTRAGDEVLELVRDGALDSLSIGFRPVQDRWNTERTLVERIEVGLYEVSTVSAGAYEGAQITALRSTDDPPAGAGSEAAAPTDEPAADGTGLVIPESERRLLALQIREEITR